MEGTIFTKCREYISHDVTKKILTMSYTHKLLEGPRAYLKRPVLNIQSKWNRPTGLLTGTDTPYVLHRVKHHFKCQTMRWCDLQVLIRDGVAFHTSNSMQLPPGWVYLWIYSVMVNDCPLRRRRSLCFYRFVPSFIVLFMGYTYPWQLGVPHSFQWLRRLPSADTVPCLLDSLLLSFLPS